LDRFLQETLWRSEWWIEEQRGYQEERGTTMTHDFLSNKTSPKEDTTRVAQAIKSFAEFDHWMDDQLESLVAQWIHAAAPNANRVSRIHRRLPRR
jgi:hypothetical protein